MTSGFLRRGKEAVRENVLYAANYEIKAYYDGKPPSLY